MADLFDYLTWRGDLSPEQSAFNETDGMILARVSYLPLVYAIQPEEEELSLAAAANRLLALPDLEDRVLLKEDVALLKALALSARFGDMVLSDHVNRFDAETQTQFSAVTIRPDKYRWYVSFRGTDSSLVGWKEDFNMAFVCPVPAQKEAVRYLAAVAKKTRGRLIVGGHSKGGNLAVYAAAFSTPSVQKRLDTIYNFDGPGFDEQVLSAAGYQAVQDKIHTFVPQSSIVGMILGHKEKHTVIHSTQTGGIMQHDLYSWEVQRDRLIHLDAATSSSRFFDYTLKEWLAQMSYAQRETFVDAIYMVLTETNARTVHELSENWFASAKAALKSLKNLDEDTRKAVAEALRLLMKSAKKGVVQLMQNR